MPNVRIETVSPLIKIKAVSPTIKVKNSIFETSGATVTFPGKGYPLGILLAITKDRTISQTTPPIYSTDFKPKVRIHE